MVVLNFSRIGNSFTGIIVHNFMTCKLHSSVWCAWGCVLSYILYTNEFCQLNFRLDHFYTWYWMEDTNHLTLFHFIFMLYYFGESVIINIYTSTSMKSTSKCVTLTALHVLPTVSFWLSWSSLPQNLRYCFRVWRSELLPLLRTMVDRQTGRQRDKHTHMHTNTHTRTCTRTHTQTYAICTYIRRKSEFNNAWWV